MECPGTRNKCSDVPVSTEALMLHECIERCCEERGWTFCASPRAMRCLYAVTPCGLDTIANVVAELYGVNAATDVRECIEGCIGSLEDYEDVG